MKIRLRDQFAMAAISGIGLSHTGKGTEEYYDGLASAAYNMADAMLRVRKRK